jgi:predicted NAD/FAD-dependent oxidoreductase
LEELENHVNKKTWHALTEASKSAKSFNDLISQLPASEKSDFLKAWKQVNPESFKKFAVGVQVPFQNDNRNDPLNLNMQVKLPGE